MPTIQKIAAEAGVSIATVSRVFSNHPNVRPEIRERVTQVARAYNYFPRLSNRRRTLILITPSRVEHPVQSYVEMVISHMVEAASHRGYRIEILSEDNIDRLEDTQFCGAIQISAAQPLWDFWRHRFQTPLIVIDREIPENQPHGISIRSNEQQGMELAVDYLVRKGHQRIGCLVSGTKLGNAALRARHLRQALEKRGLPAGDTHVRLVEEAEYVEAVGKLLQRQVDAIFAPGGQGGIITAYALALFGKRVPDDISLVVSERTIISRYCVPPQTAITQDYQRLASLAMDRIDASLRNDPIPPETILEYQLIERDSVMDRH
jgi:DNA-binding LacI/PurR family transcriptional regulator